MPKATQRKAVFVNYPITVEDLGKKHLSLHGFRIRVNKILAEDIGKIFSINLIPLRRNTL